MIGRWSRPRRSRPSGHCSRRRVPRCSRGSRRTTRRTPSPRPPSCGGTASTPSWRRPRSPRPGCGPGPGPSSERRRTGCGSPPTAWSRPPARLSRPATPGGSRRWARSAWWTCAAGSAATWWRWPGWRPPPSASTGTRSPLRWPRRTPPRRGVADRVEVRCEDVTATDLAGVDAAFVDPARRSSTGRALDPRSWSPPFPFVLELAGRVPATGAKLAPGVPHGVLPLDAEAEWVSDGGDVVECALWCGPLATAGVRRRATLLPSGATLTGDGTRRGASRPGRPLPAGAGRRGDPGRAGGRGGRPGRGAAARPDDRLPDLRRAGPRRRSARRTR